LSTIAGHPFTPMGFIEARLNPLSSFYAGPQQKSLRQSNYS
jgi:hypothetical protein